VEHKFGFAIKVRMPKPDNDERMTRHLTQDDHLIPDEIRNNIADQNPR